ncbi:MAG TPA: acyl-CoA synthetase FdrA [Nitrososphaerales archaeon]|nr:acyl-CoA synthetase FdrA [Nitrososphaerales archaeon]
MITKIIVKKMTYRDSISLMKISDGLSKLSGVTQAAVVMATELNRRVLTEAGFKDAAIDRAASDDMIIAIEAKDEASRDSAFAETEKMLLSSNEKLAGVNSIPASLEEALGIIPEANLVVISVPGQFANREASRALARGLNVFIFSSNVSREDELSLKQMARGKRLLVMGPDCGTSIINHKVLGFGNTIREGSIGLVSASGTGLQEVATLIHKGGLGISQAIGTGGGDLSELVGGITMIQGIELLEADEQTRMIVLISKPPGPNTMKKVLKAVQQCKKPVIVNFLGAAVSQSMLGQHRAANTLEDAARVAFELSGIKPSSEEQGLSKETTLLGLAKHENLARSQTYIRGLFSGGTLCYESQVILEPLIGAVYSNAPINERNKVPGDVPSKNHACIDMGAEEFVAGRAHPMIDFSLRNMRILQEAKDPETAVILLDVELGYGSNPDPAGQLVPVILKARDLAENYSRHLSFVASVVGTDGDFQGLAKQEKGLVDAGVLIMPTNVQATKLAAVIATGRSV